jgi:hypothetical protein
VLRAIIAGAFAVAGFAALAAAQRAQTRERRLWLIIAAILVALGVAKQLRLQEALTATLRSAVQARGWYVYHQEVQAAFAAAAILIGMAATVLVGRRVRSAGVPVKAAVTLLGLLIAFLILRAASIHAIDSWTTGTIAGMRRGWWVEAAVVALLAVCATVDRDTRRKES